MSVTSAYLVPVVHLLQDVPSSRDVSFRAPFDEAHEFEPRPMAESDVPLDAQVDVALTLQSHRGGLVARGVLTAPWRALCRRCSKPIFGVLHVAVNERFEENPVPEDEEAYALVGDFADLSDLVHDAVFLELPVAPLCRPDCLGLCPHCGIDRNDSLCDCRVVGDARWSALDGLRSSDENSSN